MHEVTIHNEAELLCLVRAGDKAAFELIYEYYWERLYRVAKSKVMFPENAEEIVQDIFVDLWERRETLVVGNMERYLYRAVKHKVLDYIRNQIVRRQHADLLLQVTSDFADADADEELAYEELKQAFYSGLEDLPEKTREIFRLSRLEHLSVKEISRALDTPERTVSYHLAQAMSMLRIHLRDFIALVFLLLH